jgi:hypothetical protein
MQVKMSKNMDLNDTVFNEHLVLYMVRRFTNEDIALIFI